MCIKTILAVLLLAILVIACAQIAPPTPSGQQGVKLDYSVSGCDTKDGGITRGPPAELVDVDVAGNNVKLVHHLNYVCCAKIKADLAGIETTADETRIMISEKNEGEMCRCMCDYDIDINLGPLAKGKYTVQIFGVQYQEMLAEKIWEQEIIIAEESLAPAPQPKEGFCGTSTNGQCSTDSDCTSGGCSGQVCQSKSEEPMITTCEYRDCYNAEEYGVKCSCINRACAWK